HADAEDAFAVTRRPARQPAPGAGAHDWRTWIETPVDTHPHKRFVDVADGERGLAVLSRGLPEYEALPDPHGAGSAVALTLLRAVGWLSRDDLTTRRGHAGPPLATPEAQGLGPHVFEYALVPHPKDWRAEDALVPREAQAFEAPLRAVTTSQHAGPLGARWSFVYVTPAPIVVSAVKRAEREDALVVRLYNPLETPLAAEVILALPFREVVRVDLNEDAIASDSSVELARILSTGVRTRLRGGEIQTLLFRLSHLDDTDE
ncbi:MAG TPA: glycosyl hydrolase-related protein, partial [Ktedonobacterales bacterium]|nr:glycosyl hydrolase-related protein [Ktedonobacterales bacterium]